MEWRRLLALILITAACGNSSEAIADTNCADPTTPEERVRFQVTLIDGTVTSWDGTTATVAVHEIWRGVDMPPEVTVIPEPGRAYTEGVRYLIFPTNSREPFIDTPCSATVRWSDELADLRPTAARVPDNAAAVDADLPWEWLLGGLGALALGGLVWSILNRRRPMPTSAWDPDHRIADEQ